jgi:ribosomal protein S1
MSADSSVENQPAAADAAPAEDPNAAGERPSQRILIGSQRESAAEEEAPQAKPMIPAKAPQAKREQKHYPPPNIRDQLSPELEAEYLAAVGDTSFNDLMQSSTAGEPPTELAPDTRVTGRVAKVHRDDIFIDLPNRTQGVVPLRQFETPPVEGTQLELVVSKFDADEGLYELTLPTAAVSVGDWDDVNEGQIVEVTVTGSNKGGLECQIAGLRGFIPLGQLSMYRVEHPEDYVGQRLACVVTEANRDRRNLVLSHRAVMERERAEKRDALMEELAQGQLREGIVRSIKDFGAFVDLGGADGMIHVSQLSWDRVNHPSEVLEVGQKVKVRIEKFDKDTGKISLSYREVGENPWEKAASKYYVGARVKGTVSKLMDFGAFVKLEPGVEGLVHVSELAHQRVWRPSDVLSEGQEVDVKVLSVDAEKQRISLSIKALMDRPVKAGEEKKEDEDLPLPAGAPKAPPKSNKQLKGGTTRPSGGEKFGLNW